MVGGHHGDLATPAGRIHAESGHGESTGVPAQTLDDLDAFGHGGAEVTGALHQVALVQVIGAHAEAHQVLDQLALDVNAVVDTCEKNRLVAEGDAGAGEFIGCLRQLGGDLVGVVDVNIEPERMELLQHIGQLGGDAHGHEDRHT